MFSDQKDRFDIGLELLLVLVAGFVWWISADGWIGLLLLPIAVIYRTYRRGWWWRPSPLPWFLVLFLLTALIGVWAAYDRGDAWQKFWMIGVALTLFVIMSLQRELDIWGLFTILGGCGVLIGIFFLLTHDWSLWPADLALIDRLGRSWMAIRPNPIWPGQHPNIIGGLLGMFIPLLVALSIRSWVLIRGWLRFYPIGVTAVVGLVFLLTSSRAAWLALGAAMALWGWWRLSRLASRQWGRSPWILFGGSLLVLAVLGWFLSPISILGAIRSLPGPDQTVSRLTLMGQTIDLIRDFPFTGGGLASFGGLYSQYILVIPFFRFDYGHNFYLDVTLEQGIAGFIALAAIFGISGRLLIHDWRPTHILKNQDLAREAIATAFVVVLLHGLVDDALYGQFGTPFLFVLPALALRMRRARRPRTLAEIRWISPGSGVAAGLLALLLIAAFWGRDTLRGHWVANQGAVAMARQELAGWPLDQWDDGGRVDLLAPAGETFETALTYEPANRTALYRLGMIAMLRRDYETAVNYLERAHTVAPQHRGIVKTLGYAHVWRGDFERAGDLLAGIPEAAAEMDAYEFWWAGQNEPDLSLRAGQMTQKLNS